MAKKIYLALLTLITVICIIAGSYNNLRHRHYDEEEMYDEEAYEGVEPEFIEDSSTHRIDEKITEINVDLSFGGVSVNMGEGDSVILENIYTDFIEWSVEDGVLNVNSKNTENLKNVDSSYDGIESFVTIYLPYENPVEKMKISLTAGSLYIYGEAEIGTLDISSDLGDINLYYLTINDSAVIRSKMGNIDIQDISFTDLTVEEDMGSVGIFSRDDLTDYEKHCSVSLGSMYINDVNIGHSFDAAGSAGKLSVTNKMGDISLNWYS